MEDIMAQMVRTKQMVLGPRADQLGRELGFIQRSVKLTGSSFVQALVFGFEANAEASYSELSQTAAMLGVVISPQGLEQRFTPEAAALLQQVLESAVAQVLDIKFHACGLLQQFNGVLIRDSSIVSLPDELKEIWQGVGGSSGQTAALKLQVDLDYSSGELHGPILQNGRVHDHESPYQDRLLQPGALHLADLGYFDLDRLARDTEGGVYWITRLKVGTTLSDGNGQPMDLLAELSKDGRAKVDLSVQLGRQRIPCRLVAEPVPQEVADQRRRKLKEWSRRKQRPVSELRMQLASWTVLVTNVPAEMLSSEQVLIMVRVRWQVELLFKLWKSYAKIDEWRSKNPWRILCEIYAKLLGLVFTQWIFRLSFWDQADRSLFQGAKTVRKFAFPIALAFSDSQALCEVLTKLCICLAAGCRQQRRRRHPATFQLIASLA